jgi:two-component system NarL family sensor kinase
MAQNISADQQVDQQQTRSASDAESDAEQLRRRNRELSILNAIASALNSSVDLQQALEVTLAQVAELLGLRTGWIWLLHEETGESYLAAAQNLPPILARNPRRMEGRCYCLDTFRDGDLEGAANINVLECSRLWGLVDGTDGLRYHASIPLYAQTATPNKQLGVLNVASGDWRALSPANLRLLHTVGDLLSIAIERARLYATSAQVGAVEERNRLAREIHDTLAQGLAGIALQLESADALLEAAEAQAAEEGDTERGRSHQVQRAVRQALALTRANLEEARRSVLDLRAAPLEGRTLAQALAKLVEDVGAEHGLDVIFSSAGGSRPLPVRLEVGVYRIAQEALTNVLRHADARHVSVALEITPERLRYSIADDGRGFDATRIPAGRFGLLGLNERAKLLGGKLRLRSAPGSGTTLEVTVPLETPKANVKGAAPATPDRAARNVRTSKAREDTPRDAGKTVVNDVGNGAGEARR